MHYCGDSCTSCGFIETHARPDTTEWTGFSGNDNQREKARPQISQEPATVTDGKKL